MRSLIWETLLVVGIAAGLYIAHDYSCRAKWRFSGLEASWGPLQGCLVHLPNGRWLPAESLREIDITEGPLLQRLGAEIPK